MSDASSDTIATDLPINGHRPNCAESEERVGPQMFSAPIKPLMTRAIVPFPLRVGPINISNFCCEVSGDNK